MEKKMILRVGTKVEYYQLDKLVGTGKIVCIDTKNGYTVYDVTLDNGKMYWGCREQFKTIPKRVDS